MLSADRHALLHARGNKMKIPSLGHSKKVRRGETSCSEAGRDVGKTAMTWAPRKPTHALALKEGLPPRC